MKTLHTIIISILVSTLAGCNLAAPPVSPTTVSTSAQNLVFTQPSPTPPVILSTVPPAPTNRVVSPTYATLDQDLVNRATLVVIALRDQEMASLSAYVDPQVGLRFSPYAAVKDTDQVFTQGQIAGLFLDATVYTWGGYYGTGEPIQLAFSDYYIKFVYDVDFANAPQMALNHRLGVSTTLDNAAEFYAGAMIIEFYFPGFDPAMEGMDWRSLRLVFQQTEDSWYLVGIIHDQWTT